MVGEDQRTGPELEPAVVFVCVCVYVCFNLGNPVEKDSLTLADYFCRISPGAVSRVHIYTLSVSGGHTCL